jgi:hypothetical protein
MGVFSTKETQRDKFSIQNGAEEGESGGNEKQQNGGTTSGRLMLFISVIIRVSVLGEDKSFDNREITFFFFLLALVNV